jgi:large subunit ribosomal protein L9
VKIILLDDVPALGRRGEVREVSDGYARNYLIPQRLAILASPANLKNIEQIRKRQEARAEKDKADAHAQAQAIEALTISLTRQASEDGHLYGSVSAQDLVAILARQGITVEKRRVALDAPIKALGDYTVPIRLHLEVIAQLKVSVAPE